MPGAHTQLGEREGGSHRVTHLGKRSGREMHPSFDAVREKVEIAPARRCQRLLKRGLLRDFEFSGRHVGQFPEVGFARAADWLVGEPYLQECDEVSVVALILERTSTEEATPTSFWCSWEQK